jgi:hypothetical protein
MSEKLVGSEPTFSPTDAENLWNFNHYFPKDEGHLGDYLKRTGSPINCRLDLRITRLEELKKAAVLISELNKVLNHYAYETEGDEVLRVLMARKEIELIKNKLKYWNAEAALKLKLNPPAKKKATRLKPYR